MQFPKCAMAVSAELRAKSRSVALQRRCTFSQPTASTMRAKAWTACDLGIPLGFVSLLFNEAMIQPKPSAHSSVRCVRGPF